MEDKETRLADARQREAEARAHFEAAVAEAEANRPPAQGWKDSQSKAAAAAVALGVARGKLAAAERAAGIRLERSDTPDADSKLIVALVRVPARSADALRYGPGDYAAWVAEAIALQYRSDFDPDPETHNNPWAAEVAALYGARPDDGDAFRGLRVAVVDPESETARTVAAALDSARER